MAEGITVSGLRQALGNLSRIKGDIAFRVGREASLAAGLVITNAVKRATYTTFNRQTGAIQSGFGVRVGHELKGTKLNSVVVEYPQNVGGHSLKGLMKLFHGRRTSQAAKTPADAGVAFWWRFLEFGTGKRRSARLPSFMKKGRVARTARNMHAQSRYEHAHSTGALSARPWVRPAFDSSAPAAIDAFRAVFLKRTAEETDNLPK